MSASPSAPRVSIVLATDSYDTLRPVIASLGKQPDRADFEVLIIGTAESLGAVDWPQLSAFGAARVVHVPAPFSLPGARGAGVRAAAAPIVFIGETHSFPHAGMLSSMLAGFTDERCVAVVPAIANANPATALSWASYLADYGFWGPERPAGLLQRPLVHNTAFRRDALLALGDPLAVLLDCNREELWPLLHQRGYHARFLPAAQTDHVNAAELGAMLKIRFFAGALIGARRAHRWAWPRRLLYVAASPLIPALLVWRVRSVVRFRAAHQRLPGGTMAGVAVGAVVAVLGEVCGYLGISLPSAEAQLIDAELHKLRYARLGPEMSGL